MKYLRSYKAHIRPFNMEISRVSRVMHTYLPDIVIGQMDQPRRVCAKEFSDAVSLYKVLVPWMSVPEAHVWSDGGEEVLQRHRLDDVAHVT